MDTLVDDGGGHLIVTEDHSPAREIQAGGEDDRLRFVGGRRHLEQQVGARSVRSSGDVPGEEICGKSEGPASRADLWASDDPETPAAGRDSGMGLSEVASPMV